MDYSADDDPEVIQAKSKAEVAEIEARAAAKVQVLTARRELSAPAQVVYAIGDVVNDIFRSGIGAVVIVLVLGFALLVVYRFLTFAFG